MTTIDLLDVLCDHFKVEASDMEVRIEKISQEDISDEEKTALTTRAQERADAMRYVVRMLNTMRAVCQ